MLENSTFKMNKRYLSKISFTLIMALLLGLSITACADGPVTADNTIADPVATDYAKPEHWLSLPAADKAVDIFYLYPTAWQKTDSDSNICTIDNASMLKLSALAFNRQATAFETSGNVYAPYYRQGDVSYTLSLSLEDQDKFLQGVPKADVFAAFDYYIKHYNNGRPFLLAGHSQGSNLLLYLLSDYMKANPEVYSRMIAAYVIGYSVTSDFLSKNPHLKFAEGPDDTGVIISYNTEAPEVLAPGNPVVIAGALAINPITWSRDETIAEADKNLGSILLNSDGTIAAGIPVGVMNFADARVDKAKGVIICSTVDVDKWSPGNAVFGKGVYHSFDYPFYYYNIRANAANRINKYLGN
jgi:hypothetical protein